jgi:hypothetical protein
MEKVQWQRRLRPSSTPHFFIKAPVFNADVAVDNPVTAFWVVPKKSVPLSPRLADD